MLKSEVYPKAPLLETVFEIRFPGEPAVECHRDELFESVRNEFPRVLVPKFVPDQFPALQPYHFQSGDGKKSLMVALNRFAFSTKQYDGFNSFKAEVLRHMTTFAKQFRISKLNRTGLRYINMIPYTRESDLVPIGRYFRLRIEFPGVAKTTTSNMSLGCVIPTEKGSLTVRLDCATSQDKAQEVFVLDFDYAKEEDLTSSDLEKYLEESHTYTKEFFETIISDEYRKVIQGEVIA
ncbi:MAG: TIGR04255 family protein [Acidobacteria bacterium]|nr:TIGR04255 family protein [Acidobacteriota bacterium]